MMLPAVCRVFANSAIGAVVGFLTRPCCVVPAALSVAGVGSAGLAQTIVAYRPVLLVVSAVLLAWSMWMSLRRDGGSLTKVLPVVAAIAGFVSSLQILETL